jgi:hypothetical protein
MQDRPVTRLPAGPLVRLGRRLLPLSVRDALRRAWYHPSRFWDALWRLGLTPPIPPTEPVKRRIIARYAKGLPTFVETGTYRGDTVALLRKRVREVWTIELAPHLAAAAQARFAGDPNVHVLEGDSATVLPDIVAQLDGPALFWIDAHWSTGETARGEVDTPLLTELDIVLARNERDVVLVDDVRFLGAGDYPSLEAIRELVDRASPRRSMTVAYDMIRIVPA